MNKIIVLFIALLFISFPEYRAQDENTGTAETLSKYVKTGNLNIEVSNYDKAIFQIDSLVTNLGGIIAKQKESTFTAKISNDVIIRVPTENFSTLVYKISEIAKHVSSKEVKALKVNEELASLNERLKAKNEIKHRYMQLVENSKIALEIKDLEGKITAISKEILALENQISNFNESKLSTLNVSIKQQALVQGKKTQTSADLSKNAMADFFRNILFYSLVPVILLIAFYFLVYRRIKKAKRRKRRSKSGTNSPW